MARTIDGIRLSRITRLAEKLGAEVRSGTKHPYILNHGRLRPCPIATSTHAEKMVAPWIAKMTGYTKREAYQLLRAA